MGPNDRVVILIDMDCFYCQVEEKLNPELKDKPIAVVQYNAWRGGGIIAVNYPARGEGVTRHMRGNEAKRKCPSIQLVTVPEVRGKADLTKYREAGKEVAAVLATFTPLLQRASVDEAYLDITKLVEKQIATGLEDLILENLSNTFVVGSELKDYLHVIINKEFCADKLKLAVGGLICEQIRSEVFKKTGYKCSAGIAHNKVLAKLVCSLHKPNKQTILPQDAVEKFFETMPINKIKNLGGKFGQRLSDDFQITFMGQLAKISEKDLMQKYDEKTANWLYNIAKGIDVEPVTTKLISKSIACCKNFAGITALTTSKNIEHWLQKLAEEMEERLEKDFNENNRKAKQIIVSFTQETQEISKKEVSSSRTIPLISYNSQKIARSAFEVIKKFCLRSDGSYHVKYMGLNASNFENIKKVREITSFFQVGDPQADKKKEQQNNVDQKCIKQKNCDMKECTAGQSVPEQNGQDLEGLNELNCNEGACPLENHESTAEVISNIVPNSSKDFNLFKEKSSNNSGSPQNFYNMSKNKSSFFEKYFVKDGESSVLPKATVIAEQATENANDSSEMHLDENTGEICAECGKVIPLSELLAHQDYHFAVKLSRGETSSQKPLIKAAPSGKKRGRSKNQKDKTDTDNALTTFLKRDKEEDSAAATETCQQCNKRIRIEEISSHMDYHAAKRIHLEINAIKSTVKPANMSKAKNKKTTNQTSHQSVISFFRPP